MARPKNVFFTSNDVTFVAQLKSFIRQNKYGYYIDISVPENVVTKLMKYNVTPIYNDGFKLRCRVKSNSYILCNGVKLSYLSDELNSQELVTSENTVLKVLYLRIYSDNYRNDAPVVIERATFRTESQKLPINFQN